MNAVLAGAVLGFLGSLHCLGMCGPLVLALPGGQERGARYYTGRLLYNAGRVMMYSLLGAVVGMVGGAFRMSGLQQWLSIAVGVLILLAALFPARISAILNVVPGVATLQNMVRQGLSSLFSRQTLPALVLIGLLNGFLPCCFVYMALGAASTVGSTGGAALFMAGFGAGTIPLMFGVSVFGGRIGVALRARFTRAVPIVVACVAALLILRGMNLGIPYVSPKVDDGTEHVAHCH